MGIETAILPTAILSTHTAGFTNFAFVDMQQDLSRIVAHWYREQTVDFDAVYTGYLGQGRDVDIALAIAKGALNKGPLFVDPAFGDHGALYPGFTREYVTKMKELCAHADVLLPNLTEAYALLDREYCPSPSEEEVSSLLYGLRKMGAKTIVLKGVGDGTPSSTGIRILDGDSIASYCHKKIERDFHGTGDIFASVFVGEYLRENDALKAGQLAADFVARAIENTLDDEGHRYGVHFEPLLKTLMD